MGDLMNLIVIEEKADARRHGARLYQLICFWIENFATCVLRAAAAASVMLCAPAFAQQPDRAIERAEMVKKVALRLDKAGLRNDGYRRSALDVLRATPRHLFVPPERQAEAYQDRPLDIGYDQTISDPMIVALMSSLLHVKKGDRILEIGTGSGYQAAILAQLGAEVFSIEIVDPLARAAAARLKQLGYSGVQVRSGDGYAGWPEQAPFDAIIVTAGALRLPPALVDQLRPGGRMVIPLGPNWAQEKLMLVTKAKHGRVNQKSFGQVFFVDFTGAIQH